MLPIILRGKRLEATRECPTRIFFWLRKGSVPIFPVKMEADLNFFPDHRFLFVDRHADFTEPWNPAFNRQTPGSLGSGNGLIAPEKHLNDEAVAEK